MHLGMHIYGLSWWFIQIVKNPPAMQETWVQSLGWEDPLEEGMATYSNILAWGIFRDRGVGWAIIAHGVAESDTTERLSIHSHTYTSIYVSFSLLGVNHTFSVYYIICAKLNITLQLYSCMIK